MDIEAAFLSKIVMEGLFEEVIDMQFKTELLVDHLEVWEFLLTSYQTHGQQPPVDAIKIKFPSFEFTECSGALSFYHEELRKRWVHNSWTEGLQDHVKLLKDGDPFAATEVMREVLMKVDAEVRPSRDVNIVEQPLKRIETYRSTVESGGAMGLPTLWPCLDEVTMGFQPEDLVMFAGRGKVGKTWAEVALAAYHWSLGYPVLLFSREMAVEQIIERFDSINTELPYQRFRAGMLTEEELRRWEEALRDMENGIPFWVTGEDEGGLGVTGIAAKIQRHKPRSVWIDGVYLIDDDLKARAKWERFSNICQGLKTVARRFRLPIGVTHQFNLAGVGEDGSEDTLKFGDVQMWFDWMVGMYISEELRLNKEMKFKMLKNRKGPEVEWVSSWDLDKMNFRQKIGGDDLPPINPEEQISY